jgi:PAS domain S-box-containing protein
VSPDDFLAWAGALPEPTILATTNGKVLAANRAVERRLGVPRTALVGQQLADVVSDPPDRVADYLRACSRSGELVLGALTLTHGGREIPCRCEGAVLRRAGGGEPRLLLRFLSRRCAVGQFVALTDKVRELAREIVRRQEAERALKDLDRRKDEFIATLAHELRNPLAPITTSLYILRLPGISPGKDLQAREVIERQVGVLGQLLNELLDVSRLMRNKLQLEKEQTELETVVQQGVKSARPLMDLHGHQLTLALPPERVVLDGDLSRLALVVAHLLRNAAKFTDPGGRIDLTATVRPGAGAQPDCVEIRVRDNGIGIPADSLGRIFEPFVHEEWSPGRQVGGLGVGLTLVKRLVEMHGGTVAAESDGPGQGSTFTVRLPVARDGHGG